MDVHRTADWQENYLYKTTYIGEVLTGQHYEGSWAYQNAGYPKKFYVQKYQKIEEDYRKMVEEERSAMSGK